MEKIYEENQQQRSKKLSLSIVLSFIVAVFAVVSLIAVGFNQISYAAPIQEDSITLHKGSWGAGQEAFIRATDNTSVIMVPMFFADSTDPATATQPLFCIEHGIDASETSYNSESTIYDDFGLIYILNQSKVLGGPGIVTGDLKYPDPAMSGESLTAEDQKYVEMYATQIAIWLYLHEKYPASDSRHGKLDVADEHGKTPYSLITGQTNLYTTRTPGTHNPTNRLYSGNLYNSYVKSVVEAAKNATNYKTVRAVMASDSISKVGDDDTYQTDKISVAAEPASDLVNYSVDLSGIDGAYIVDKDGNKKTALDTFAPSDIFYVRVPVNKVTKETSSVKISIVGEFQNYLGGDYYVATGSQAVVGVTSERFRVANETTINFLVAPDTGMSTAQTIYFIGLIVLLCGVGIIYANAKPVEEK